MQATMLKHFDQPDEMRTFPRGRFEIVHLAGASLGRATYQPGWKWSEHNSPLAGRQTPEKAVIDVHASRGID